MFWGQVKWNHQYITTVGLKILGDIFASIKASFRASSSTSWRFHLGASSASEDFRGKLQQTPTTYKVNLVRVKDFKQEGAGLVPG